MKLKLPKNEVVQVREVPGLLNLTLKSNVTSATGDLNYEGPPFPEKMWWEILAFFKWTYDDHKSESQVRLYVNASRKTWAAWAYPQEARTGMSAREIDNREAAKQREQFKDSDGWIYFGTVHHHCGGSAFQSPTDKDNEEIQDGIHITVGKMNEKLHDLHCRLYIGGSEFDPDMSYFWPLNEKEFKNIPDDIFELIPGDIFDKVARHRMCIPAPKDTEFPKQWRDNVIEIKSEFAVGFRSTHGFTGITGEVWVNGKKGFYYEGEFYECGALSPKEKKRKNGKATTTDIVGGREFMGLDIRQQNAVTSLRAFIKYSKDMTEIDAIEALNELNNDPVFRCITDIIKRHNVDAGDILRELKYQQNLADQANRADKLANGGGESPVGNEASEGFSYGVD